MNLFRSLSVCSLLAGLFASVSLQTRCFAQRVAEVRPPVLNITAAEFNFVRSPDFKDKSHPKATSNSERWFQPAVVYDTAGGENGWINSLKFDWSILLLGGDNPRVLMSRSVTYVNVAEGKDHRSAVFIDPRVLRRYYGKGRIQDSNVYIHLEAFADGVKVAEFNFPERLDRTVPARWWTFTDARAVLNLPGALMSRDQTPFAAMDCDFWEMIKPPEGK